MKSLIVSTLGTKWNSPIRREWRENGFLDPIYHSLLNLALIGLMLPELRFDDTIWKIAARLDFSLVCIKSISLEELKERMREHLLHATMRVRHAEVVQYGGAVARAYFEASREVFLGSRFDTTTRFWYFIAATQNPCVVCSEVHSLY